MLPYVAPRILKSFKFLLCVAVTVFFLITYPVLFPDSAGPRYPPQHILNYSCPGEPDYDFVPKDASVLFNTEDVALTESRILVLVESIYSKHGKLIIQQLNATKVNYKVEAFAKHLPLLTKSHDARGRFSSIVIENYHKYLNMPKWNRQLLDKYCKDYKATIVSFIPSKADSYTKVKLLGSNLTVWQNQKARNLSFSSDSDVLFVSRPGAVLPFPTPDSPDWVLFDRDVGHEVVVSASDDFGRKRAAVIRDRGMIDGVGRILFGHNISNWVMRMAFLDSMRYATKGRFGFSLERMIQIDIDDIFVGSRGTRMVADDVHALIRSQEYLRGMIANFSYTLGFSGSFMFHGDDAEDEGDRTLIEKAKSFYWFPHMWRHNHAQELNYTYLEWLMTQNKLFAESNAIPVPWPYAIAPQHAGVYPVHDPLYDAWRSVWRVRVTATEEYPHFRPPTDRRGFVHKNISVLPRQTCGLYTHTQLLHRYPGGIGRLLESIQGGELFFSVLLNPLAVFMTHQQNYAHDRLGHFTFSNLLLFLSCWTNIRPEWRDPIALADRYFELFPQERTPIWNNPCVDERHVRLLPPGTNCSSISLPNLLIVGPQKTGSTALASFLSLHPNTKTNAHLEQTFEEVQFFSGQNYGRGWQWYSSLFEDADVIFEKSATYFDASDAPRRAFALIPNAQIIVILVDPSLRAYSWYQHLLSKNDTSVRETRGMEDVLEANSTSLRAVRQRCVSGGRYAHHLERWLEYFPASQMLIVDGEELRDEPVSVLENLSRAIELPPYNFQNNIKFVPKKKFYCRVIDGAERCLGRSKGRSYPPPSASLSASLCQLFREDNVYLDKLLVRHGFAIPKWLPRALIAC